MIHRIALLIAVVTASFLVSFSAYAHCGCLKTGCNTQDCECTCSASRCNYQGRTVPCPADLFGDCKQLSNLFDDCSACTATASCTTRICPNAVCGNTDVACGGEGGCQRCSNMVAGGSDVKSCGGGMYCVCTKNKYCDCLDGQGNNNCHKIGTCTDTDCGPGRDGDCKCTCGTYCATRGAENPPCGGIDACVCKDNEGDCSGQCCTFCQTHGLSGSFCITISYDGDSCTAIGSGCVSGLPVCNCSNCPAGGYGTATCSCVEETCSLWACGMVKCIRDNEPCGGSAANCGCTSKCDCEQYCSGSSCIGATRPCGSSTSSCQCTQEHTAGGCVAAACPGPGSAQSCTIFCAALSGCPQPACASANPPVKQEQVGGLVTKTRQLDCLCQCAGAIDAGIPCDGTGNCDATCANTLAPPAGHRAWCSCQRQGCTAANNRANPGATAKCPGTSNGYCSTCGITGGVGGFFCDGSPATTCCYACGYTGPAPPPRQYGHDCMYTNCAAHCNDNPNICATENDCACTDDEAQCVVHGDVPYQCRGCIGVSGRSMCPTGRECRAEYSW